MSSLRASDSDREHAAKRLRQATAEGRLTADEFEERLEVLFGSRTYGELDALLADLPAPRSPRAASPGFPRWAGVAGAGAFLVVVLGMLGAAGTHSAFPVARQHPGRFGWAGAGPGPGAHQIMVGASVRLAVLGILVACAILAWAFMRSRGTSRS
jgi:Domain of unknown function (DUF1707)